MICLMFVNLKHFMSMDTRFSNQTFLLQRTI